MESKESIRLQEIRGQLKTINANLAEQTKQFKNIAASLQRIHDSIAAFKESRIIGIDISQEESNELQ